MPPIGRVPLFLHLVGINSHFLLGHSVAVTTAQSGQECLETFGVVPPCWVRVLQKEPSASPPDPTAMLTMELYFLRVLQTTPTHTGLQTHRENRRLLLSMKVFSHQGYFECLVEVSQCNVTILKMFHNSQAMKPHKNGETSRLQHCVDVPDVESLRMCPMSSTDMMADKPVSFVVLFPFPLCCHGIRKPESANTPLPALSWLQLRVQDVYIP